IDGAATLTTVESSRFMMSAARTAKKPSQRWAGAGSIAPDVVSVSVLVITTSDVALCTAAGFAVFSMPQASRAIRNTWFLMCRQNSLYVGDLGTTAAATVAFADPARVDRSEE